MLSPTLDLLNHSPQGWSPASLCFRSTKVILTIFSEVKAIAKEKTHVQEGLEAKEEEMTKMMLDS